MKAILFFFLLAGTVSVSSREIPSALTATEDCGETPEMNKKIIDFVNTRIKKKVGTGQCWDLASQALTLVNATWDGAYKFGTPVDPKNDCIFPGDIIQFEGVVVEYEKNGGKWREDMSHHTAIIYEVKEKDVFTLAHQNIGTSGKKVGLTSLDLKNITKGKYQVFRPTK